MRARVVFLILATLLMFGCQEQNQKAKLLGHTNQNIYNPNSLAAISKEKANERANRLEIAKIDASAKIETKKIEAQKDIEIAKIDASTQKEVANSTAVASLKISQIDAKTKEKASDTFLMVTVVIVLVFLLVFYLWYKQKKEATRVKAELEKERLKQEKELKEREFQEQRINKVLELAVDGKLPKEIEKEVIEAIAHTNTTTIEHKKGKK